MKKSKIWSVQIADDEVHVKRGAPGTRVIPLRDIAGVEVIRQTPGRYWVRIRKISNDDYSYAHDPSKDLNTTVFSDQSKADSVASEIRAAAGLPGESADTPIRTIEDVLKSVANSTESLFTMDGAIVLDSDNGTVHLGVIGGPIRGASASVSAAGEIRRRVSATRVVATGILALAWRKKVDDRELYLTVDGTTFQFVARVDPKHGAEARQFAARISSLGKR